MMYRFPCRKSLEGVTQVDAQARGGITGTARRLFGRLGMLALLLAFALLQIPQSAHAQTTATISGTVQDASGGVIPGAKVTLTNEATGESRTVQTNQTGLYVFPSLVPSSYSLQASATGFQAKKITGIQLHAGDERTIAALALAVGTSTLTVTVSADSEMIPVENGEHNDVLSAKEIENLALQGRDTTELLKVLPGATTVSGGLTQTSPEFSDLNVTVQQSAIGMGININGSVMRGGTTLLVDGANVIDPGDMASALMIVNPDMTQEASVQSSAFTAEVPFGPVVVSTISKSGGERYHGEGYFDARNSALDANDWQSNHAGRSQGPQHYYYPGGNIGGPVPYTHDKLFFWGGYERWLQNQGNANVLNSYIPSPEMIAGDFTTGNADNNALCPNGFFQGKTPGGTAGGPWCSDMGGTMLSNGTAMATPTQTGTYTPSGSTTPFKTDAGQDIPTGFLDPGGLALTKIWPKANANPATTPGGYNYVMPILNINDGWLYRFRVDYHLGDNTKIYGSYQQAYDSELASGNGAHLYWTPGNSIPYPGGGEQQVFKGKAMAGHFVHIFNSSTTMDFMAAWAYGSFPFTQPDPSAVARTTLGYTYGKVFSTNTLNIPAYSSAGNETFPDFSQDSIFDNPPGMYKVTKEAPQFSDTVTKLWRNHTIKIGGFTQTTDNDQSTFSSYMDGDISSFNGQNPNVFGGTELGSQFNPVANLLMGVATGYSENNSAPIADTAYMATAAFVDDTWKATNRLTLDLGLRIEHVGHWYDRDHVGMAVFYPERVLPDFNDGKYAPGYAWHSEDAGVPLSGQPNRFAYVDPRFGLSYDVFGNGNTVVRGGWGAYRFVTQVNDVAPALVTAQHMLGYGLPGSTAVQLSKISDLTAPTGQPLSSTSFPQCCAGTQVGFDPSDYGQPLSYSYNLTVDQRLPWNTQLEVAYVGSSTSQLSDDSEGIEGSDFGEDANQNKMPIGALFNPDPVTGTVAVNPENVGTTPTPSTCVENTTVTPPTWSGCSTPSGHSYADYHPYGLEYGTNAVTMIQSTAYTNYNALQVSWTKTSGHLTFNLNGTWSKTLATSLQANPYNMRANYGPASVDRPFVYNASYTYQTGQLHTGSQWINQLGGGWTISGISTWQAGGYIPSFLGNGVPNFSMGLNYSFATTTEQAEQAAEGNNGGLSQKTYFGTDESGLAILPKLTCNPTSNLAKYQVLNGSCFTAPSFQTQGGQAYPYMRAAAYMNNDLAIYRSFRVYKQNQVQFRMSAFDWLNHPLPEFANTTPLTLSYNEDYDTHAISPTYAVGSFGKMTTKSQAPYQRIIELNVKYFF